MDSVAHSPLEIPSQGPPKAVAVIDIGATSIRMATAEIQGNGQIRPLDTLVRPINLGQDAFTSREISRSSIEETVRILRSYQRVLDEYGISSPDQMRVVATSAVREANNRLQFLDRIYIATGIHVEPIDEAEVNRIAYIGIQPQVERNVDLASAKTMVVEIGGGSTELLVVQDGNVLSSSTHRLGSLRLALLLESLGAPDGKQRSIMETQIGQTLSLIRESVSVDTQIGMIGIGGDIRFAARQVLPTWDGTELMTLPLDRLANLTNEVLSCDRDRIVKRYGISFAEASTLGPALLTYLMLAQRFQLESIHVSDMNLRGGLLRDMAVQDSWTAEFRNQILRSARSLGRKFDFDEVHAGHVAELAQRLFSELASEHRLDSRFEVILSVAALLHEVGNFLSVRSNHKHAFYLIRNSELFGLSRQDVMLVGLVARYYRRAFPQPSHDGYANLSRDHRVAVSKMAAILRLAIALDESRSGRIKAFYCIRERNRLVIQVAGVNDVSLEQLSVRQNGKLFEEIFGTPVLLRPER